jgi:D-alanine--poly(phosphoribitol) ligase subunit 2
VNSKDRIREFVSSNFGVNFGDDVDEYSNLFQLGFLNSYGYLKIMSFLESEFGIAMTDDDVLAAMPSSLSSFCEFVEQRKR